MCVWTHTHTYTLQRYGTWPLLPSTSVWISPRKCVFIMHALRPRVCPLWTLRALSSNLQGQDRNFLPSSRDKSQPSAMMQAPPHLTAPTTPTLPLPFLPLTFSPPLIPRPSAHPLIPAWVRADGELPTQRAGFKSGGLPCICVSKVRLPCRMLSVSGRWLWGERDDSTGPRGWCVKRYGKTRINRGPGILPDWMWPKLSVDPRGEIKEQLGGGNQAPLLTLLLCVLWKVSAEVWATINCAFVPLSVIFALFEETN